MSARRLLISLVAVAGVFVEGRAAAQSSGTPNSGTLPIPTKAAACESGTSETAGNCVVSQTAAADWNGTIVDLMTADALAQCLWPVTSDVVAGGITIQHYSGEQDDYLAYVLGLMGSAACGAGMSTPGTLSFGTPSTGALWAAQRGDPTCNVDPSTGLAATLTLTPHYASNQFHEINLSESAQVMANAAPAIPEAQGELEAAEINLCLAQRLNEYASTASVLTMSANDQRELLEMTRERAQVALLQYAGIGNAILSSSPGPGELTNATTVNPGMPLPLLPYVVVPVFVTWVGEASNASIFSQMGSDFSAAMQLHTETTKNFAQLLGRSGSAHDPRGGMVNTPQDDDWGPGSWRQRLMALLYGGDPLQPMNSSAGYYYEGQPSPWTDTGRTSTSPGITGPAEIRQEVRWPGEDITEIDPNLCSPNASPCNRTSDGIVLNWLDPYVNTDTRDPHVSALLSLARQAASGNAPTVPPLPAALTLAAVANPSSTNPSVAGPAIDLVTPNTYPFGDDAQATSADPYWIFHVDVPTTATNIFNVVEASLENSANCSAPTATSPCTSFTGLGTGATTNNFTNNPQGTLLWTEHSITPDHATALAGLLASASPKLVRGQWSGSGNATALWDLIPGGMMMVGDHNGNQGCVKSTTTCSYVLDPKFQFAERDASQLEGLYTRLAPLPFDLGLFDFDQDTNFRVSATDVGLYALEEFDGSALRIMGATTALAMARWALVSPAAFPSSAASPSQQAFFHEATAALGVVNSAIGTTSFAITPNLFAAEKSPDLYQDSVLDASHNPTSATWKAALTVPAGDPLASGQWTAYFVRDSTVAELASQSMTATGFSGTSVTSLLSGTGVVTGVVDADNIIEYLSGTSSLVSIAVYAILPTNFEQPASSWTVIAVPNGATPTARILAQNLFLTVGPAQQFYVADPVAPGGYDVNWYLPPEDGQIFSYQGDLGDTARQAMAHNRNNWSQPAFDGFGLPIDWVPPTDPSLFGGSPGEDAVTYYLTTAQTAADSATAAVKAAMDALLQQETDTASQTTAQIQAAGIDQIELSGLCGTVDPNCDTSASLQPGLTVALPAPCPPVEDPSITPVADAVTNLCASVNGMLNTMAAPISVFTAVQTLRSVAPNGVVPATATLSQSTPPAFSDYSGGTLQSILLQQWNALQQADLAANDLIAALDAVVAEINAAYAQLHAQIDQKTGDCSFGDMIAAWNAGNSVSVGFPSGASVSFNAGPLTAQIEKCQQESQALADTNHTQVDVAITNAFSALQAKSGNLANLSTQVQQAIIAGLQAQQQTNMAQARANLQASLTKDNQVTMFGDFIRYHSYDMWRAQALVESARRYAATARRAIEAHFVVDFSQMTADEPFVANPSSWADTIFEYDLDVPAAVGLSTSTSQAGGIYPNVVSDYVSNLQAFVAGYAIARPTAVAKTDPEIFSVAGPDQYLTSTSTTSSADGGSADGGPEDGGAPTTTQVLSGVSQSWELFCPSASNANGGTWIKRGSLCTAEAPCPGNGQAAQTPLNQACPPVATVDAGAGATPGTAPTYARVTFDLDPWGRLEGEIDQPPLDKQFNGRWQQFAVNLVGAGVKNCALAADPTDCYAESYIPYDATHYGPTWVTDYNELWHALGSSLGQVEAAKALAAEQFLDPVANGWSQTFVTAIARGEWVDQPLGGTYVLSFAVAPEVVLENIEEVQVLVQESYWVIQN